MLVKKLSGELIDFDKSFLISSLSKSGATKEEVEQVYENILPQIYNEIKTKKLYIIAFKELKKIRKSYAARYSLKKAIQQLGPSGYNFEIWITHLFTESDCQATHSQNLQGRAVNHEIDVVAVKNGKLMLAECKFRNDFNEKVSVTTPMYFLSRFNDLKDYEFEFFGQRLKPEKGWLITNAGFTSDSIMFAETYGIKLLSWNYPENSSIKKRVDLGGLYPITCLTSLNKTEKITLLKNEILLVKELLRKSDQIQNYIKISDLQKKRLLEEAYDLINYKFEEEEEETTENQ